jgi:diguanylate cyclase (GGDEF)-like protein
MPVSSNKAKSLAYSAIQYVAALLNSPTVPELPPELEDMEELRQLQTQFMEIRGHLLHISRGDLSQDIKTRGYAAGLLKRHLANLRHLTWQVEQVARGDFTQRVDFMGDFSKAFNSMVVHLDTTLTSLRTTEEALTRLTNSLRQEVEMRTSAVNALKLSEARFKYLADHDPLTGALNRRSFLLIAETGLKNAYQSLKPCSFAMLDVDHFKKFNDTYGHLDGDLALKHVVKVAQSNLRQSDCMGRYGGEEFIFFFADADRDQGFRAAERIRKAIGDNPVHLESGPVYITASVGVSTALPHWPGERDSVFLQKMVLMADGAVYQSKQNGRDRVTLAPEQPPQAGDVELVTEIN